MCAYTVTVNGTDISGYVDDGEYDGGAMLTSAIEHKNLTNISVFVAQVYGGVHSGGKRFKCIAKVDKEAIDTYIKNQQNPGIDINCVCTDNIQHCSG